ncbi:thiamine diphosphokinase [Rhodohalobacter sp. SW132]|uniref:thiamine diphosphokinase n=1 Tax=Rhodohalobacter sp. SW132 TaxID=2293433 RepID=UPI0013153BC1|nr:thiamine diphosphokinase [Rhodohalobacter sp. SW132]
MKIGKNLAVILCNGEPPEKEQLQRSIDTADLFIAADGGGNIALQYNLLPDIIIGDLDSFHQPDTVTVPVLHKPDQNINDLEKALNHITQLEVENVLVFGATGQRLDHTVKNLSVMKQFHNQFNTLVFRDKFCDIKLINSPHTEQVTPGTQISLFPLSGKVTGISSSGLKYKLNNHSLENGVFDGTSNESVSDQVVITYESGDLLLFINHQTD